MSLTHRTSLAAGILLATLLILLGLQGATQEVETQPAGQGGSTAEEPSFPTSAGEDFARGQIIVKLEEGATQADLASINRRNGARTEENLPESDVNVVDLPRDLPVREAVQRYEASPDVEYAEPDFLLQPARVANDPYYANYLYGLNNTGQTGGTSDADVDAPEAWEATTGNPGVVVAVIDEGVDIQHPDLRNNIWVNADEVPDNSVDDDNNGYVDDINGWDFANNDASVYDPDPISGEGDEHGTHVAGTIAAEGNNGVGVSGVSWDAGIMVLKFLGPTGGYTSDAIEALDYAVNNGAKISNNSWGGGGNSQTLQEAIAQADARGHLVVAAAGNGGSDGVGDNNDVTPSYPASYSNPNIISVAATDDRDIRASFSNYGANTVDLAAPGVDILSTLPARSYGRYSGTSMATPHVTGAAALLKSQNPDWDDAQIKSRILQSVDAQAGLEGKMVTGGRLNASASLVQQPSPAPADTTPPDTDITSGPSGVIRAASAEFTFTASEEGSRFQCRLDDAAFSSCTSPEGYSGLTSRDHAFSVRAIDAAGNVDASPDTRRWTVDTVNPGVSSLRPTPGSSTSDRTPAISATVRDSQTDLASDNIALYLDGREITTFSYDTGTDRLHYTPLQGLPLGWHAVKVVAKDAAGNTTAKSWKFKVVRP